MSKPTVAIIGTGWSGFTLSQSLNLQKYNIISISPIRTIQYTPLLASAATGMFNFRLAEEPVRRRNRTSPHGLTYHKSVATSIDFTTQTVTCSPSVSSELTSSDTYEIHYDKLIIAPGCSIQTFNTPGALENALFLRTTNDARLLQQRLLECLDAASLPGVSPSKQSEILSIRIIGAGAIGIEAAAELYDLWNEDMQYLYPNFSSKLSIHIHDIAPTILSTFDQKVSEYALESLKEKKVKIHTESHIERVEKDAIFTKEMGRMPCGICIWATGNKVNPLVEGLDDVRKPEKGMPRILTDNMLRVLRKDGSSMDNVYAMGDAADIEGHSLPTLAEVALQKGEYLSAELNQHGEPTKPFEYKQRALLAYLGKHDGVIGGKETWTGQSAWIAWRSGSLAWTRSWRRRFMISLSWLVNWIGGRDIARRW